MAVKIISKTTTFQEFEEIQKELISWNKGRKTLKTKTISYWGLIAIIENKKIKGFSNTIPFFIALFINTM